MKEVYDELLKGEAKFPTTTIKMIVNKMILKNETDAYENSDDGFRSTITADHADRYHRILSRIGIQQQMATMLLRPEHYGFEDENGPKCQIEGTLKAFFGLRE